MPSLHHCRHCWARLGLAALLCLMATASLADTRILLTLDWPPYTGVNEPGGGSVTTLVNKAFKSVGDDTRIGYFTWRRVLQLPRTDRRFAATYPMYYSEERSQRCYFSEPIGESPVGLAEMRQAPISWKKVEDLKNYKVGVVKGYVNSLVFDRLMQNGTITALAAETDEQNLKNLLAGRVQAAVIDPNVLHYMTGHVAELRGMESQLQLNPRLLVVNPLFMCFPRDPEGLALRDRFNKGLAAAKAAQPDPPPPVRLLPITQ